jgi:hypothetical protein
MDGVWSEDLGELPKDLPKQLKQWSIDRTWGLALRCVVLCCVVLCCVVYFLSSCVVD